MGVQVSLFCNDLHFFGHMAGSYNSSLSLFFFFEGLTSTLISIVTAPIHIAINSGEGSFPSHPCQQLLLLFLMTATLIGVRWNLSVVLICISFMAKNAEHFFTCLLAFVLLLKNCLFSSFAYLLSGLFVLLAFNF
jgi:hypothetical protein